MSMRNASYERPDGVTSLTNDDYDPHNALQPHGPFLCRIASFISQKWSLIQLPSAARELGIKNGQKEFAILRQSQKVIRTATLCRKGWVNFTDKLSSQCRLEERMSKRYGKFADIVNGCPMMGGAAGAQIRKWLPHTLRMKGIHRNVITTLSLWWITIVKFL